MTGPLRVCAARACFDSMFSILKRQAQIQQAVRTVRKTINRSSASMKAVLFRSILACFLGAGLLSTMSAQGPTTPLTFTYTYSGYGLPIPIDDANIAVLLNIIVPRSVTITKVTASVQINYPAAG